jgi:hypothetical protein
VIVVDASILANALADDQAAGEAARGELRAADRVPTLQAEGSWRDRIEAITTATNVPRP